MTLSIIIVNFRAVDFLESCLQSIYREISSLSVEIIVVDSGSYDGSGEMLEKNFPKVIFIQAENIGFARANNLAAKQAAGRFLLFLNPDTEVIGDALAEMVRSAEMLDDFGIGTCRLLNGDETTQTSCVQAFPTITNQVVDSDYLRRRFPRSRLWGMRQLYDSGIVPGAVEAVSGACMLIKREVFLAVGGFCEEYFMYSEDIDLCYKVRRTGLQNYLLPKAKVVHYGGQSSKSRGNSFADVMIFEARYRFLRKHRGKFYASVYRLITAAGASGRLFVLGNASVFHAAFSRGAGGWRSRLQKWGAILRWSVGLERWIAGYR